MWLAIRPSYRVRQIAPAIEDAQDADALAVLVIQYDIRTHDNAARRPAQPSVHRPLLRLRRQRLHRPVDALEERCGGAWVLPCDEFDDTGAIASARGRPVDPRHLPAPAPHPREVAAE